MEAAAQDASTEPCLAHLSLNPNAETTVLLIHGAFSTGGDWDLVTPLLADYHLLVPDLPGHGQSRTITPFSVPYAASLLKNLITEKAHNGTAYVVGGSLGAKVAICLASTYPEVVSRVMVSGFEVFPATRLSQYIPYAMWLNQRIENWIPRPIVRWLMDGTDIQYSDTSFCTLALCQQICRPMTDVEKWPSTWPHPTLIIAAEKSGILPTSDHPHDAKKLASIGNQMNSNTKAVTHLQMRHPWMRQAPMLFAATIRAWHEGEQIPNGFVDL